MELERRARISTERSLDGCLIAHRFCHLSSKEQMPLLSIWRCNASSLPVPSCSCSRCLSTSERVKECTVAGLPATGQPGQSRVIASQCKKIREKLKNRMGHTRTPAITPGAQKMAWANSLGADLTLPQPLPLRPPWLDETEEYGLRPTEVLQKARKQETSIKNRFEKDWKNQ